MKKSDVKKLEDWYRASQDSQRELLKRVALADRLAKAAGCALDAGARFDREGLLEEMRRLKEALAAYRSPEKEEERDEEV